MSVYSRQIYFYFSYFSIYKMVDSEYSTKIYQSLNTSIGTVMRNLEMLAFVPDHLKPKTMCKHAVKKLPFLTRYVSDHYKTPQMC